MAVWMIRCPQTGRPVSTGGEITEGASKRPDTRTFSQCRHCGRVHGWTVAEAWRFDGDEPPKSVWTID
jgi:ribosomal protein S14